MIVCFITDKYIATLFFHMYNHLGNWPSNATPVKNNSTPAEVPESRGAGGKRVTVKNQQRCWRPDHPSAKPATTNPAEVPESRGAGGLRVTVKT